LRGGNTSTHSRYAREEKTELTSLGLPLRNGGKKKHPFVHRLVKNVGKIKGRRSWQSCIAEGGRGRFGRRRMISAEEKKKEVFSLLAKGRCQRRRNVSRSYT